MTEGMALLPTYSRMVASWSDVGGSSVTSSWNSERWMGPRPAWSAVEFSAAAAETCFRRVATRAEAGELALWKRVMMSSDLGYTHCAFQGISKWV